MLQCGNRNSSSSLKLRKQNLNRAYKSLGVTLVYSAITATITISIVVY